MKKSPLKRKTPLRKQSNRSLAGLKRRAWKVFADFVKKRDRWICCTCGKRAFGPQMNAGHFIPKSLGNIYLFHEKNVHAQCAGCNNAGGGMPPEYYEFMLRKYGQETINELKSLRTKQLKLTKEYLKEIIKKYE